MNAIPSLAYLSLGSVSHTEWLSLDAHSRSCMVPSASIFDNLPVPICIRMASLVQLLEQQAGRWSLAPGSSIVHDVLAAYDPDVLHNGDHIVIMRHGYAHHGIIVADVQDRKQVIDFASPSDDKRMLNWKYRMSGSKLRMRDAEIRIVSIREFLRGHATFGIVPYTNNKRHRDRAASIARALLATPKGSLPVYNLLNWNCECFAWICQTGGVKTPSDQIKRILKAIQDDLKNGTKSFIIQYGASMVKLHHFLNAL